MFRVIQKSGNARIGVLQTMHGEIETPFFMTIATVGAVKGAVSVDDLYGSDVPILLSNTYHNYVRLDEDGLSNFVGLHKFMNWNKPILTDSGGYQVFSLSDIRKIKPDGVEFHTHTDGRKIFFTPQKVVDIQMSLGSDIMMVLDECAPYPCEKKYAQKACDLTVEWARKSISHFCSINNLNNLDRPLIFAINQGSVYEDLRIQNLEQLKELPFDGYAIGGLSVGEPNEEMYNVLSALQPYFVEEKPRYLMGVGTPLDIVEAIDRGIDMFDCVLPTRNARHGFLYTNEGTMKISRQIYKNDYNNISESCDCYTCRNYSRAYLHHTFKAKEMLSYRLLSIHNIYYYQKLMQRIKDAIRNDNWNDFKKDFINKF